MLAVPIAIASENMRNMTLIDPLWAVSAAAGRCPMKVESRRLLTTCIELRATAGQASAQTMRTGFSAAWFSDSVTMGKTLPDSCNNGFEMIRFVPLLSAVAALCSCAPKPESGNAAPNAALEPLDSPGKTVSIHDIDSVRVIDFWATWCGPCRQTMPFIQKLHDDYGNKGVQILGVTQEPRGTVAPFERSSGYNYPIYLDPFGSASRAYNVTAIPKLFVIDKRNRIVFVGSPFDEGAVIEAIEGALKS